ncbi:MAG: GNAT family N-acetyltransferase [Proteobacteria bacterium]|nr:GNAT family N-acetyltransferase [Pseudomonadota bacterium]MBI3496790.1 GNAT family N-acetyltransferase [Pseudomonadota bacterium]
MSTLGIRLATAADADAIANLSRELLAFYGIQAPAPRWVMAESIRSNVFSPANGSGPPAPGIEVLLADRDGIAVGLLAFVQVYSVAVCQGTFFIQDIFVSERWRGEGVGRQMMDALAKLAGERGVDQIDWTADPWNDRARRFYDRLGPVQRADKVFYRMAGPNLRFFTRRVR